MSNCPRALVVHSFLNRKRSYSPETLYSCFTELSISLARLKVSLSPVSPVQRRSRGRSAPFSGRICANPASHRNLSERPELVLVHPEQVIRLSVCPTLKRQAIALVLDMSMKWGTLFRGDHPEVGFSLAFFEVGTGWVV